MAFESHQVRVRRIVDALEPEVDDEIDRDTLTAVVEADLHRYAAQAKFTDFVPVLVERDVRDRVRRHRRARRSDTQSVRS